jgi:DNA-binding transcriptional LysR family regulator
MVNSICGGAGFSPRVVHYCDHVQFMLSLIAAGLGMTILPKRVELLPRLGVAYVPLNDPFVKMNFGVCYRSSQVSGVVATFLNVARKAFSAPKQA